MKRVRLLTVDPECIVGCKDHRSDALLSIQDNVCLRDDSAATNRHWYVQTTE